MSVLLTALVSAILLAYWWTRGLEFQPLKLLWWVCGSVLLFVCSVLLLHERFTLPGNVVMLATLAYTFGVPLWWLLHPRRARVS